MNTEGRETLQVQRTKPYPIHIQIYSTPSRSRSGASDAKTGPKTLEGRGRKTLHHHIGELLIGGYMENTNTTKSDVLPNEVNVELDMLRPAMMNRISREVDRGDIVTVDNRGLGNLAEQLL
jgi:hypothetical protein